MQNKKIVTIFILSALLLSFVLYKKVTHNTKENIVKEVISPTELKLQDGKDYKIDSFQTFDCLYSKNNSNLANKLNISEDEGFILGCTAKYWAENILKNRHVTITDNNLIYYHFGYEQRLENSAYCFKEGCPVNKFAFEKMLNSIRKGKFVIVDLDTDNYFSVNKTNAQKLKNFVVIRKNQIKKFQEQNRKESSTNFSIPDILYNPVFKSDNIKIIVSDSTTKIIPDRNCSSEICKEILNSINNAQNSIDIAIYGYSSTPAIEKAINKAKSRGVKIRLVYDIDANGNNIYPDTAKIIELLPDNKNDKNSAEVRNTMHNKFYIFDGKKVITGSANLSHTDMSGFNSNSIIEINMPEIAKFYENEFEQMYYGKFHNDKISNRNKSFKNITVYFSPQDKAVTNGVLPLIKNAKKYIYIPAFVITEKKMTEELKNAKKRGVDVKIIVDALNASTQHSKHKELRSAGILLKAENYAGKMHSKTIIIDDEYLIIGSMNFSNSGENRNDENMVILKDSNASKYYKNFFIYQWNRIDNKWLKSIPRAESWNSIGSCTDGIDNNYDDLTDKDDEGCKQK